MRSPLEDAARNLHSCRGIDAGLHIPIARIARNAARLRSRLRVALRKRRDDIAWVNIWDDDAGRAYVASVNGGDETVPTVVIDGTPHTNPAPRLVTRALRLP